MMDIDHYNRTGEVIPLTQPEVYEQPEKERDNFFEIPASTKEEAERRKEMLSSKKPPKEQLEQDIKAMNKVQIAKKYEVSRSAVVNWLRSYGLYQPEPQKTSEEHPEPICDRECQVVVEINELPPEGQEEEFPTATPAEIVLSMLEKLQAKRESPIDDLEERLQGVDLLDEAWTVAKDSLVMIRAIYIQKAEMDFEERFRELMKSITGGEEVC
ncbi:hypothetical protein [Desulfitobacterium hafniense]|uniref:hypothetical protein n=1 Tax=Desulfitobacterium hafniense TaxID=49338 RepID=UPI001A99835A|nr:hypothetical protein [Desulfitobacterium hafniense]